MGRKLSNSADYFYHRARPGKTLFILESKWGNDGYAFWFKLLELLTASEGHFFDTKKPENQIFFDAKMHIGDIFSGSKTPSKINNLPGNDNLSTEKTISGTEILDLLSDLGKIDSKLWKDHGVIWCQNLVDSLAETLYKKRDHAAPAKPCFKDGIISPEIPSKEHNLPGNEKNDGKKNISGEIMPRGREREREGGNGSLPPSPSALEEEPQEKPSRLDSLRKVNPGLTEEDLESPRLASIIASDSWETIVASYRLFCESPKQRAKAFWIFLQDFPTWKKQIPKPPPPAQVQKGLEDLKAEMGEIDELKCARDKRDAGLPLTPEEEALLAEADAPPNGEEADASFPESATAPPEPEINEDTF